MAFRGLKQTPARRKVLAKTPERGAMELAANILALALLLLYAAFVMGAKVGELSLAKALRAIRWAMERVRHGEGCWLLAERLRAAVGDNYKRRLSKRARDWPHKKKERPPGRPHLAQADRTRKSHDSCSIGQTWRTTYLTALHATQNGMHRPRGPLISSRQYGRMDPRVWAATKPSSE